jgi:hypothetical protein
LLHDVLPISSVLHIAVGVLVMDALAAYGGRESVSV